MRAWVNGEAMELPEGTTLRALVEQVGARPDAVAVARNGEVVPRARLATVPVAEGDKVEIIRAVGGG